VLTIVASRARASHPVVVFPTQLDGLARVLRFGQELRGAELQVPTQRISKLEL